MSNVDIKFRELLSKKGRLEHLKNNIDFENSIFKNFVNLTRDELQVVLKWRNFESIRKWMRNGRLITLEEHLEFARKLSSDNKKFYYLCFIKDVPVGVIDITELDIKNKNAYWGIYTRPDKIIPKASHLMRDGLLKIIFEYLKLNTLKLEVFEGNETAIRFNRMSGFKEEGRLRKFIIRGNKVLDVIVMGMLKEEFCELYGN
jgi:UDP-4-amino-4,6-dideoxy-N-acetyl-beta-L-altrosamine N-acetyltransferase